MEENKFTFDYITYREKHQGYLANDLLNAVANDLLNAKCFIKYKYPTLVF